MEWIDRLWVPLILMLGAAVVKFRDRVNKTAEAVEKAKEDRREEKKRLDRIEEKLDRATEDMAYIRGKLEGASPG